MANDACGGPSYQSSANNTFEYNYYSNNMSIFRNPSTNTTANNIAVSGAWDAHAQDIITCAGAGAGTVTTLRTEPYVSYSYVRITNKASANTISSNVSYTTAGDSIVQKTIDGSTEQVWNLVYLGNSYYKVVNQNGLALTPSNHNTIAGTALIQWNYEGNNDQQWSLTVASTGYYKLTNRASGLVFTPSDHSSVSGTQLIQWNDESNTDQEWKINN